MNQFNMGQVIQQKRKEKGLTQEELASAMGVSKSSVSKWETGQTYPDIYLLPELATFFSITIDTLMAYQPNLTKQEINSIYSELSLRFGSEDFETVFEDYEKLVKKYYASQPFLLQMAVLLINYFHLIDSTHHQEMYEYIINLTKRVKEETTEASLMSQANILEAFCQLQSGNTDEALSLLNYDVTIYMGEEQILSKAYAAKGDIRKAQEVLQVTQYQYLMALIITSSDELLYEVNQPDKFNEIIRRVRELVRTFELEKLHPFLVLTFLNSVFLGYTQQFRYKEALDVMEEIVDLMVKQVFPIELHGDDYFYLLENWMKEQLHFNNNMPRDEKTIKESLIQFFETHPGIVTAYQGNQRYEQLIKQLKENKGD